MSSLQVVEPLSPLSMAILLSPFAPPITGASNGFGPIVVSPSAAAWPAGSPEGIQRRTRRAAATAIAAPTILLMCPASWAAISHWRRLRIRLIDPSFPPFLGPRCVGEGGGPCLTACKRGRGGRIRTDDLLMNSNDL